MPSKRKPLKSLTRRMSPRRMLRLVYKDTSPLGSTPTSDKDKEVDALIRDVFLEFDFTPLFSGNNMRARLVATDIYNEVMSRAREQSELEGSQFTEQDVSDRWKALIDKQIESLEAFKRRFGKLL